MASITRPKLSLSLSGPTGPAGPAGLSVAPIFDPQVGLPNGVPIGTIGYLPNVIVNGSLVSVLVVYTGIEWLTANGDTWSAAP